MTTLHIIVEITEQVPTGRTEWRVDCGECDWYDIFDDRGRADHCSGRNAIREYTRRAERKAIHG